MDNPREAVALSGWQPLRFEGRVVYRQVLRPRRAERWLHYNHPGRWNPSFAALYTSLSLDVALAERLKRTGTDVARLSVGVGEVVLERVVDLTTPEALKAVGVTLEDITLGRDYRIPHRIATRLYADGITGLLAPAALASVSRLLPRFVVRRDEREETRETPTIGVNLVIYPANLLYLVPVRETDTFDCTLWGLSA